MGVFLVFFSIARPVSKREAFIYIIVMSMKESYLFAYNVLQALGWTRVLVQVISSIIASGSLSQAYTYAGSSVGTLFQSITHCHLHPFSLHILTPVHHTPSPPLNKKTAFFQLLAALEILHPALGLVGGSPITALMQWGGRSNVFFAIIRHVPVVQTSPAVGATLLAWALSEVIRYPWYAAGGQEGPPWLTWLRYTAFIPLYPVGVVGEMLAVFYALPYIRQHALHYVIMPNAWNFGFDYSIFMTVRLLLLFLSQLPAC